MGNIEDFSFVSRSGLAAVARLGVGVDPYSRAEKGLASKIWYEGIVGARWRLCGKDIEVSFEHDVLIYPAPSMRYVVVVFQERSMCPHNALVLNADGTVRFRVRQPARYVRRATEFLWACWYERDVPQPQPPWWAFWRKPVLPNKEIRMEMFVGGNIGVPNLDFEALDFDPETGEFGDVVESGRL